MWQIQWSEFLIFTSGTRHERSWRVAGFFGSAALAGAFGGKSTMSDCFDHVQSCNLGILAFTIGKMDGLGGKKGWQWRDFLVASYVFAHTIDCRIFILEGVSLSLHHGAALTFT